MAAGEAAQGEPRTAPDAEACDGKRGILRTGGQVDATAGADGVQHWRNEELIRAKEEVCAAFACAGFRDHEAACAVALCGGLTGGLRLAGLPDLAD